ncbi:MAG: glycosyltransferase [Bacteroidota bacterium]
MLMIGNETQHFKNRSIFKYPFLLLRWLLSSFSSRRVIVTSCDRATTVSAYFQSDLFFFTSQIECSPIVIFEAAAAGLPFLSTDVGNVKEIASWTNSGELMATFKDENGFSYPDFKVAAIQLEQLLNDGTRMKKYSESGRKSWMEKFTWEAITNQYLDIYNKLIS